MDKNRPFYISVILFLKSDYFLLVWLFFHRQEFFLFISHLFHWAFFGRLEMVSWVRNMETPTNMCGLSGTRIRCCFMVGRGQTSSVCHMVDFYWMLCWLHRSFYCRLLGYLDRSSPVSSLYFFPSFVWVGVFFLWLDLWTWPHRVLLLRAFWRKLARTSWDILWRVVCMRDWAYGYFHFYGWCLFDIAKIANIGGCCMEPFHSCLWRLAVKIMQCMRCLCWAWAGAFFEIEQVLYI